MSIRRAGRTSQVRDPRSAPPVGGDAAPDSERGGETPDRGPRTPASPRETTGSSPAGWAPYHVTRTLPGSDRPWPGPRATGLPAGDGPFGRGEVHGRSRCAGRPGGRGTALEGQYRPRDAAPDLRRSGGVSCFVREEAGCPALPGRGPGLFAGIRIAYTPPAPYFSDDRRAAPAAPEPVLLGHAPPLGPLDLSRCRHGRTPGAGGDGPGGGGRSRRDRLHRGPPRPRGEPAPDSRDDPRDQRDAPVARADRRRLRLRRRRRPRAPVGLERTPRPDLRGPRQPRLPVGRLVRPPS